MSEATITPLRPKAKDARTGRKADPTNGLRQQRFRNKRKAVVTVPAPAHRRHVDVTPTERDAPQAIAHPTPPPLAGRVEDKPARNGSAGITFAALTAALALATVSGGFSIYGMTAVFTGATVPVMEWARRSSWASSPPSPGSGIAMGRHRGPLRRL